MRNSQVMYKKSNGKFNECRFFKNVYHANDAIVENAINFKNTYRIDEERGLLAEIGKAVKDQVILEGQVNKHCGRI